MSTFSNFNMKRIIYTPNKVFYHRIEYILHTNIIFFNKKKNYSSLKSIWLWRSSTRRKSTNFKWAGMTCEIGACLLFLCWTRCGSLLCFRFCLHRIASRICSTYPFPYRHCTISQCLLSRWACCIWRFLRLSRSHSSLPCCVIATIRFSIYLPPQSFARIFTRACALRTSLTLLKCSNRSRWDRWAHHF